MIRRTISTGLGALTTSAWEYIVAAVDATEAAEEAEFVTAERRDAILAQ